jgi:hypothetical protein
VTEAPTSTSAESASEPNGTKGGAKSLLLGSLALLACSLLGRFFGPLSLAALGPGAAAVEWLSGLAGVDWLGDKGTRLRPLAIGFGMGTGVATLGIAARALFGTHLEMRSFEVSPLLIGALTTCLMAFQRELLEHAFLARASHAHPQMLRVALGIVISALSAWGMKEAPPAVIAAALLAATTMQLWTRGQALMAIALRLGYATSVGTLFAGSPIAISGGTELGQWLALVPLLAASVICAKLQVTIPRVLGKGSTTSRD